MASVWLVLSALACLGLASVRAASFGIPLHGEKEKENLLQQHDVYGSQLNNKRNMAYYGKISVGTPPKIYVVSFDTGSSMLWLPKYGCKSEGAQKPDCNDPETTYDPEKSSTSEQVTFFFEQYYGKGYVRGAIHEDFLSFGPSNELRLKKKVKFGIARYVEEIKHGIFGLGLPREGDRYSSIFDEAVQEGIVDRPMFTVWLQRCEQDCDNGGLITFGDLDKQHCEPVKTWAKVLPNEFNHWRFAVDNFKVMGKTVRGPFNAIVDTDSSFTRLPFDIIEPLLRDLEVEMVGSGPGMMLVVPCNKTIDFRLEVDGAELRIPSEELVMKFDNYCVLAISLTMNKHANLGQPFIRSYCHVHNYSTRRIGFAPVKKA